MTLITDGPGSQGPNLEPQNNALGLEVTYQTPVHEWNDGTSMYAVRQVVLGPDMPSTPIPPLDRQASHTRAFSSLVESTKFRTSPDFDARYPGEDRPVFAVLKDDRAVFYERNPKNGHTTVYTLQEKDGGGYERVDTRRDHTSLGLTLDPEDRVLFGYVREVGITERTYRPATSQEDMPAVGVLLEQLTTAAHAQANRRIGKAGLFGAFRDRGQKAA